MAEGNIDGTRLQRGLYPSLFRLPVPRQATVETRVVGGSSTARGARIYIRDDVEQQEIGHTLQPILHRLIVAQLLGEQKHTNAALNLRQTRQNSFRCIKRCLCIRAKYLNIMAERYY